MVHSQGKALQAVRCDGAVHVAPVLREGLAVAQTAVAEGALVLVRSARATAAAAGSPRLAGAAVVQFQPT